MRKQAPRHLAPAPRGRRVRGIAAGLVGTVVAGLAVYGLSQTTAAAPPVEPVMQVTVNPEADGLAADASTADTVKVAEELSERQSALVATKKKTSAQADRLANTFVFPADGKIGSPWGMRLHPILHIWRMHEGVDIGASCGSPIRAVLAGTVTEARFSSQSGNHVRIDHGVVDGKRLETDSLHQSRYVVAVGDQVQRGQVIGYVGSTGLSTECHLHFAFYEDGTNSDPAPYLADAERP